jgi:hypothetical protein
MSPPTSTDRFTQPAAASPRRAVQIITRSPRPRTAFGWLELAESMIGGVFGVLNGVMLVVCLIVMPFAERAGGAMHWPAWISMPLAAATLVFDGWFIAQVWSCVSLREFPFGPALAARQRRFPGVLGLLQAIWWLAHVALFLFASVGMHRALAMSGSYTRSSDTAIDQYIMQFALSLIVFGMTFTTNLYLMLTLSALTRNTALLERVWRWRFVLDSAITLAVYFVGHTAARNLN